MEVGAPRGIALILGAWLTTIRDTIRSSRAIPRPSSSSSHAKIKNIGRRVTLAAARPRKSARRLRARALALPSQVMPALEAARVPLALAAARLALRLLRVGEARRPLARRVGTLRVAQARRYRRRVLPTAAKRQVVRLPLWGRRPRARRGPHPRSHPCKLPSPSRCSPVRTARRTTS